MTRLLSVAPVSSTSSQTVGLQTITCCSFDLDAPQFNGRMQNAVVHAEFFAIGQIVSTGSAGRAKIGRGFKSVSAAVSSLGALDLLMAGAGGTLLGEATILSAAIALDFAGNVIRGRVTGIAGLTINWTGHLYIASNDFTEG